MGSGENGWRYNKTKKHSAILVIIELGGRYIGIYYTTISPFIFIWNVHCVNKNNFVE